MALDGLIFDLDGTLVDTNHLHVRAWHRVFAQFGFNVPKDRIEREIGQGGDTLVPQIVGQSTYESVGEAMGDAEPREFAKIASAEGIKLFDRVVPLLRELRLQGLRTALATSSGRDSLQLVESLTHVRFDDLFDAVVTSDDAERSKPAPDLVHVAARKLGLTGALVAMVGDTPFDAASASHAGATFLGVTGGRLFSKDALFQAGARGVWVGPADLLKNLDDALSRASRGRTRLTEDLLNTLMSDALRTAERAMEAGEVPIACVIARGDGTVIARAFNRMNQTQNKTAHAEIMAFAAAAGKCPMDCRDLILVSTLEPCVMCTGAAMEASVDTIVFALPAPADNGHARVAPPRSPEAQMPRFIGGVLKDQSRALFKTWLDQNADTPQAAFVNQLLSVV